MRKLAALTVLLCFPARVVFAQEGKANEFAQMKQIVSIAAAGVPGKDFRVVFASEDSLASMHLRHWIVTIGRYPENYRTSLEISPGAPCTEPESIKEVCSIQEIPGEPLFRGTFDVVNRLYRFAGRTTDTAQKFLAFRDQLRAHPDWTQDQVVAALASAGAKYGPDKKNEFMATIPLKSLERVFGPMRLKDVTSIAPVPMTWPAYWQVRTVLLREPKTRLVMYFEPFEGRLQLLHVSQPVQTWDPGTKKLKWKYPD